MDEKVVEAMKLFFAVDFYNPSAAYTPAREVRAIYEDARHRIAQVIGAKPAEIIMTAGATESINLAFQAVDLMNPELIEIAGDLADSELAKKIITTAIEHPAVLETAQKHGAKILSVDAKGCIDLGELKESISDETQFISIGYANNEIGTVQPIKEIAGICNRTRQDRAKRGVKTPLIFHTDASQAAGLLDMNVARLGVDMMTLNAGKCYGPKQVGLLFVRAGVELQPLMYGGGQEMNLRSGTENVAGVVGFAKALEIAERKRKSEVERLGKLRDGLEKFIKNEFPEIVINGHLKHRLANMLNFSISGLDGERVVFALDIHEIYLATGSACAANKGTRSHVLSAIGLSDDLADGSLRISLGRPTTEEEIEKLRPILAKTIREQLKFGRE